jgi:hypothetical protein
VTEQRYRQAISGLAFEQAPATGYYRALRGSKVVEYPESGRVDGGAYVSLRVLSAGKPSSIDVSEITLVDPDGMFQFRMAIPYSRKHQIVVINPVQGTYILHLSGKGLQDRYVTFDSIKDGGEYDLGDIALGKAPQ